MIYILLIEAVIIISQLCKKKYVTSGLVLYFLMINTFISPSVYYEFLHGQSYINFSQQEYQIYQIVGIIYLAFFILADAVISQKKLRTKSFFAICANNSKIIDVSIIILCSFFVIYIYAFRRNFPLLQQFIYHRESGALDRPDVSGSIPGYFTVSTAMSIFVPTLFLYVQERKKLGLLGTVIGYSAIAFVLLVGGNKGLMIYFLIFVWIYILHFKIDWRIAGAGLVVLGLYAKSYYNGLTKEGGGIVDGLVPPVRRFFVTQGAMFINRIPLIENKVDVSDVYISGYVYSRVYKGTGGSAPTYFVGDLIVQNGYLYGMIISLLITVCILVITRIVDCSVNKNKLYIFWIWYYLLFIIGMSGFNEGFIIRTIIATTIYFLFALIDKDRFNVGGVRNVICD